MKSDHYLVIWEGYPLKKDYTWEPIENLYGHEELVETYEQWPASPTGLRYYGGSRTTTLAKLEGSTSICIQYNCVRAYTCVALE